MQAFANQTPRVTHPPGTQQCRAARMLCVLLLLVAGNAPQASEPLQLPPASRAAQVERGLPDVAAKSVARAWNEVLLAAIRRDTPRPTVHARNLFHVSAAMFDAWAAFGEDQAVFHQESALVASEDLESERTAAISHAAYRVLSHRFLISPGHEASQAEFDDLMLALGLNPHDDDVIGSSGVAIGNRIGQAIIDQHIHDGANESAVYRDTTGYTPLNLPMFAALPGTGGLSLPNVWQPLFTITGLAPQNFLTPHWFEVEPFALERPAPDALYLDPGQQPLFSGTGHEDLVTDLIGLVRASSWLDPDDGEIIDISPGVFGNHPPGSNDGIGHGINPVTSQPYPANPARRGDWARAVAEFWEDGPLSSTPPGHWNEIANAVSDRLPEHDLRIGGYGAAVERIEWDIKLYLALNAALHDAAIVGWETKYVYESSRPITLIRHLSELGQSSDPELPSYHPDGWPLTPGLIELVSEDSSAPGERHAHLSAHVGEIAIRAWRGYPEQPETEHGGVGWIRGVEWLPYQAANFVTPAFPGYISGHSIFSASAAGILTRLTGSPYFPGGLAEFLIESDGFSLHFEFGPADPVLLQWASYADAANEAGISRIFGGIHPDFDDFPGRLLGEDVAELSFARTSVLFANPVAGPHPEPVAVPLPGWAIFVMALMLLAVGGRAAGRVGPGRS
jgi:hypothetical protein